MRLILGSASPRRLALLAQIGIVPDEVLSPEIDETPVSGELPRDYVSRIAREKNIALSSQVRASPEGDDPVILTADTTVSAGRRILGKPADEVEAAQFLRLLSGRRHRVTTAVCLTCGERIWQRAVETQVRFKRLSESEVAVYLSSGEWRGKAGGYAIQGLAEAFIPAINGSYSNVVGLPLAETAGLLQGAGYSMQGVAR